MLCYIQFIEKKNEGKRLRYSNREERKIPSWNNRQTLVQSLVSNCQLEGDSFDKMYRNFCVIFPLQRSKKSMSEPSPLVKVWVGNKEEKSLPRPKTTDPKWETNFHFLISEPRHQELNLEVRTDTRTKERQPLQKKNSKAIKKKKMEISSPTNILYFSSFHPSVHPLIKAPC